MLKKLVKYGNSNALILDKAILELLNIKEGSTIKIKTDGKSLIITPHTKNKTETVSETFNHNQAFVESSIQESLKQHKHISKNEQQRLTKELYDRTQRHKELNMQLFSNPDFSQKAADLSKKMDTQSAEFLEAYKALRSQYAPKELVDIEQEMLNIEHKNNLNSVALDSKQQKAMEQEFRLHFAKYKDSQKMYGELLNNPEYIHESQLIAEKYNVDKDSAAYQKAINTLNDKYCPELKESRQSLEAIAAKYSKKTK